MHIQNQHRESLARLTFGVAHEIRNPLNILSLGVDCLTNFNPIDAEVAGVLLEMRNAISRADAVIGLLMENIRECDLKLDGITFAKVVEQALSEFNREMRAA